MTDIWNTLSLSQGPLTLTLLPGVGGRLWDIEYEGQSLLFQNNELTGKPVDVTQLDTLPTRSPQFGFPLWGGEKTWVAPDQAWINGAPFPVLDSAAYHIIAQSDHECAMQSPVCPQTDLQITRKISLRSTEEFCIEHKIKNYATTQRKTGIWSVMMLKHPTKIALDLGPDGTEIDVFGSAKGFVHKNKKQNFYHCMQMGEFKQAMPNPKGHVLMKLGANPKTCHLLCATPPENAADQYAHGFGFEVFNSGDYPYCEAEWHSPAQNLASGETMIFEQHFSFVTPSSPQNLKELFSCMS